MVFRGKLSFYFKINMTEHYVTFFDRLYLPQGLALHMSMERQFQNFKLWIVCMDEEVHDALSKIGPKNVELLKISNVETEELKSVKSFFIVTSERRVLGAELRCSAPMSSSRSSTCSKGPAFRTGAGAVGAGHAGAS